MAIELIAKGEENNYPSNLMQGLSIKPGADAFDGHQKY